MNLSDAVALIASAIPRRGGAWVDLGAGEGTFTRALVELLGPEGRIVAVDRNSRAISTLERWAKREAPQVVALRADFTRALELPDLGDGSLDGVLLANSLHYVRDQVRVLGQIAGLLRSSGRMVLVEYDQRDASPWVPYPIPAARLAELAAPARLSTPTIVARRPSVHGGELYVAIAERI